MSPKTTRLAGAAATVLLLTVAGYSVWSYSLSDRVVHRAQRPSVGVAPLWSAPTGISRLDEPTQIEGRGRADNAQLIWDSAALTSKAIKGGIRFHTPPMPQSRTDVDRVVIRVAAAAQSAMVLPIIDTKDSLKIQIRERGRVVALPELDDWFELEVEFRNRTTGWGERGTEFRVRGIVVDLYGPGISSDSLQLVQLLSISERLSSVPAGHDRIELEGITRPSWHVAPGASVHFEVTPTTGPSRLEWYSAAIGQTLLRVSVDGSPSHELPSGPEWNFQTTTLPSTADPIRITFSNDGPGIGVVGSPELVSGKSDLKTPDVLLYLVDTLRADRLGAWGREQAQTPTLDRLADEGVVFMQAHSHSAWTMPSIPTLMTGIWPTTHQVNMRGQRRVVPQAFPVLAEAMSAGGWRTGSFCSHPAGTRQLGLDRGFDTAYLPKHWRRDLGRLGHPSATQLKDALVAWAEESGDRPFFAYVHTLEVHEAQRARFCEGKCDRYDAAVTEADRRLGELLDELRAVRDRPLLVSFVADHGESLGEHGLTGHGSSLFEAQTHIPWILWSSDGSVGNGVVPEPVGLADVAPTLLDVLGLPALDDAQGVSVMSLLHPEPQTWGRPVPLALYEFFWDPNAAPRYGLIEEDLSKVMYWTGDPPIWKSFELDDDRNEQRPGEPEAKAKRRLLDWIAAESRNAKALAQKYPQDARQLQARTADDLEPLRALGYLD